MTTPRSHATRRPARARRRLMTIGLAMTLLFVGGAELASAHVTVNPATATPGSYAKLTFRVPTESATATTTKLTVHLPVDHPLPTVSVMQVPGWTAQVTKSPLDPPVTEGRFSLTEAVSQVTWTADDGKGIGLGEFAEFSLSVGPVPDVPSLTFPADQTYSDGSVVSWDQVASAGSDTSPDHPAPVLTVAPADDGPSTTALVALILGIVAVALGALAVAVTVTAARRQAGAAPSGPVSGGDDISAGGAGRAAGHDVTAASATSSPPGDRS